MFIESHVPPLSGKRSGRCLPLISTGKRASSELLREVRMGSLHDGASALTLDSHLRNLKG